MTAGIAPHGGQDWLGLVIVLGLLAIILIYAWGEERHWSSQQDAEMQRLIDEALDRADDGPLVDHVACANPDCDETICACHKPSECTGTKTLGCPHGEGLCWDCRLQCTDCAVELHTQQAIDWAAGR